MSGFTPLPIRSGLCLELSGTTVRGVAQGRLELDEGTHFGMVTEGRMRLELGEDCFWLRAGMFFVAPERGWIEGEGRALVLSEKGYRGLRQVGGPLEPEGRLRYIDGCTDTLLVCPPRLGEPCLNHLHIPAGTQQSAHTHPSDRIGVITRGQGRCVTPDGTFELSAGLGWWIPAGTCHCFHTGDSSLDVIAWHPDSDFGPTDGDHPMRNRTVLAGGAEGRFSSGERMG